MSAGHHSRWPADAVLEPFRNRPGQAPVRARSLGPMALTVMRRWGVSRGTRP